jgi:serpin B
MVRGFNRLGTDLYGRLPGATNLFFSPLSIGIALSALVPGARGETSRELEGLLGLDGTEGPSADAVANVVDDLTRRTGPDWREDHETGEPVEVQKDLFIMHVANALFAQDGYPLLEAYREVLRASFRADFFSVDYGLPVEAADAINRWVSERTQEKITDLISPEMLSPITRLVLTNAVYFKAEWADQFEPLRTEQWPFQRLDGAPPVDVDMMQETLSLAYWRDPELGVSTVEIPYTAMSMVVVLPDAGRLGAVEAGLEGDLLDSMVAHSSPTRIHLRLPRFKLRLSLQVGALLQKMGLRAAFDQRRADFSGITDDPDGLVVSEVVHEACVEVDENGTEAAAATAIVFLAGGIEEPEPDPILFTVDRPFIFLIRDDATGAILFMGRMTDPGA